MIADSAADEMTANSQLNGQRVIAAKNLNLRLNQQSYDWFHKVRGRLRKRRNQETLLFMLKITENFLDKKLVWANERSLS